jgi:predicted ATPase
VFRGVMKKLKMLTDTAILDLPIQKDQSKCIVMHVLSQMMVPLEMLEMHYLCLMASCYAVTYSLEHGISELSPEAFVLVGGFMISIVGSLVEGYRMGELALKLSNEVDSDSY